VKSPKSLAYLTGKREFSLKVAKRLHKNLDIDAEIILN